MKTLHLGVAALAALIGLASASDARGVPGRTRPAERILSFGTMYGVEGPFIGEAHAIGGIPGDELPWAIGSGRGSLMSDGRLRIHVRGLVFTNDPSVPQELQGKNDEKEFRAVVSCLTENAKGKVVTRNVTTRGFRATESGDCNISTIVDLPSPCVAPIVFVIAGSENKWFATTGFEAEED